MALLAEFIKIIPEIAIISDYGIFTAHSASITLKTVMGQQISLFTPDPQTVINCQELKWPLVNYQFKAWYHGTLNEAVGDKINLEVSGTVIVYRTFVTKAAQAHL